MKLLLYKSLISINSCSGRYYTPLDWLTFNPSLSLYIYIYKYKRVLYSLSWLCKSPSCVDYKARLRNVKQQQQRGKERKEEYGKKTKQNKKKKNLSIYKTWSRQGPRVCLAASVLCHAITITGARLMESSPKIGMDFVFCLFL